MALYRDAISSSQIEGYAGDLQGFLERRAGTTAGLATHDADQIENYVRAAVRGHRLVRRVSVSHRLIAELHAELMHREPSAHPGAFRDEQIIIGAGADPAGARPVFTPPPPDQMERALQDYVRWARGLARNGGTPGLVNLALGHAQLLTIHPFVDGNGRVARLLTSLLIAEEYLGGSFAMSLSVALKRQIEDYYRSLTAVREHGDWEGWVAFFVDRVLEACVDARHRLDRVADLVTDLNGILDPLVGQRSSQIITGLLEQPLSKFADVFGRLPVVVAKEACAALEASRFVTVVPQVNDATLLVFAPYIAIFDDPRHDGSVPVQQTMRPRADDLSPREEK